jgi:hypothetical protein
MARERRRGGKGPTLQLTVIVEAQHLLGAPALAPVLQKVETGGDAERESGSNYLNDLLGHKCYRITRSSRPSGGLRCSRASDVYAWFFGTRGSGGSYLFARCMTARRRRIR